MAIQNEPTRIQIPFADSGTKNVIPDTNSTPSASQAASWTDGFPAQCSLPLSAGGIPPARADFNGIFNTMTQSERFTQEGGVWAWDATVDYGTNRVVLGSDGLLYWSIAQSGPNVGGAQDPTADDGTYWQAPYAKTMPALDSSDAVATTRWARQTLSGATLYVNGSSGSDTNDGLSSAKAVKTIGQALALAGSRFSACKIYIAASTYTENITISSANIEFALQGNIVISGSLTVQKSSVVVFNGSHSLRVTGGFASSLSQVEFHVSSLTVESLLEIANSSYVYFGCTVSASNSSAGDVIVLQTGSIASFASALSVSGTTISGSAINISSRSYGNFSGKITCSVVAPNAGISVVDSACNIQAGIDIDSSNFPTTGLTIAQNSVCLIAGNSNIYGNNAVDVSYSSSMFFRAGAVYKLYGSGAGHSCLHVRSCAAVFYADGSDVYFYSNTSCDCGVDVESNSHSIAVGSGVFGLFGTYTSSTVRCTLNGCFELSTDRTVNGGTVPTAKRYIVNTGGQIDVNGAGASRIPGNAAGTADSASFGYYG
jgi:hypothetical protein